MKHFILIYGGFPSTYSNNTKKYCKCGKEVMSGQWGQSNFCYDCYLKNQNSK